MDKLAQTQYSVHDLLARRWSPRPFADRLVAPATLGALFEAARWAASAFNEQPWRLIVARREEGAAFQDLLECLTEGNRSWAGHAAVVVLCLTGRNETQSGKPNAHVRHDLGLATAQLVAQATALGLDAHAMAGILPDKARDRYVVPDDFDVVTGLATGYLGDPATLPDPLREWELAPRRRRPLTELVFSGAWNQPVDLD